MAQSHRHARLVWRAWPSGAGLGWLLGRRAGGVEITNAGESHGVGRRWRVVADLFFPILGLAVVCAVTWRFLPPGPARTRLQVAGTVLLFAPLVAAGTLWKQSIRLVPHREGPAVLCLGIAAVLARRIVLQRQGRWPATSEPRVLLLRSPTGLSVIAAGFGIAGLLLGSRFGLEASVGATGLTDPSSNCG